jgi:hypothetical protein
MPVLNIERAGLPREMHDALKRHVLRERQRKKDEADANEADKQRRRAEKVFVFLIEHIYTEFLCKSKRIGQNFFNE